jgi:hypothetical protein
MANQNYGAGLYGAGGYGNDPVWYLPAEYYANLLTRQFATSASFVSMITARAQCFVNIGTCLQTMDAAFSIQNAVGVQLDQIAASHNITRVLQFQPRNGVSPVLVDSDFRTLILAKIAADRFSGSIDSLQPIWQTLYPGATIVVQDNHNMSATVLFVGAFTSLQQDMITHGLIVPQSQGVLFTYSFSTLPVLGFDEQDGNIAGFDSGNWS